MVSPVSPGAARQGDTGCVIGIGVKRSGCCDECEQDIVQCCFAFHVSQSLNFLMPLFLICKVRMQYHL